MFLCTKIILVKWISIFSSRDTWMLYQASHQKKKTTESADNGTKTIILLKEKLIKFFGFFVRCEKKIIQKLHLKAQNPKLDINTILNFWTQNLISKTSKSISESSSSRISFRDPKIRIQRYRKPRNSFFQIEIQFFFDFVLGLFAWFSVFLVSLSASGGSCRTKRRTKTKTGAAILKARTERWSPKPIPMLLILNPKRASTHPHPRQRLTKILWFKIESKFYCFIKLYNFLQKYHQICQKNNNYCFRLQPAVVAPRPIPTPLAPTLLVLVHKLVLNRVKIFEKPRKSFISKSCFLLKFEQSVRTRVGGPAPWKWTILKTTRSLAPNALMP